jgi:hypothetical protein
VQSGIERAFFDFEQLLRGLMDPFGHCVTMKRPARQGFEDKHFKRALDQVAGIRIVFFPKHLMGRLTETAVHVNFSLTKKQIGYPDR